MRIVLTNDDGILAPGLAALERIAAKFAGPDDEIFVVAPEGEQSGVSHCLSYLDPYRINKLGPDRYAVAGTPADCVVAAVNYVLEGQRPDLILSGVNRGNNSAENAPYSGTLGAALEGALQGVLSVALSQYLGPQTAQLENPFEGSEEYAAQVIQDLLAARIDNSSLYEVFYNVNFPPVPADEVAGRRIVPQGKRQNARFGARVDTGPNGRTYLWSHGFDQRAPATEGTDAAVNLEGFISITPMRADFTAHDVLAQLKHLE